MNIVQITPGTGNFHCGSCLRDVALAREIRKGGHDEVILPLYLPLVTEEDDPEHGEIFFGGINVYLQQKFPLFRKTPPWMTRFLDHPGLLRKSAGSGRMTSARELGEMMLSMLRGEQGKQRKELDQLVDWIHSELKPDIICLSNGLLLGFARRLMQELQVPVVCTLQGEDGFIDSLPGELAAPVWKELSQRASEVQALIPVSRYYGEVMRERTGLPAAAFTVVQNGVDFDDFRPREKMPDPPVIGYLARLCSYKGLGALVEAFILLHEKGMVPRGTRLHAAGAQTSADAAFVEAQRTRIRKAGLEDRVSIRSNISLEEKAKLLSSLTVFSVPATYGESFGLYVVEALASAVPVVQPRHGGFTEILEASEGGLLCKPDHVPDLAAKLAELIHDPVRNRALGETGRIKAEAAFGLPVMAGRILDLYQSVMAVSR